MDPLSVTIKRIEPDLPLPAYHTAGAVGFDLYTRKTTCIAPDELVDLPSNLIIQTPTGYGLVIAPRSSTPKLGLAMPHSFGLIDPDFAGVGDEIHLRFRNTTNKPVQVKRGQRLAQGFLVALPRVAWREVANIEQPSRGGFGTTGA